MRVERFSTVDKRIICGSIERTHYDVGFLVSSATDAVKRHVGQIQDSTKRLMDVLKNSGVKLPEFVDLEVGGDFGQDSGEILIIRYNPKTNKLTDVRRQVSEVKDFPEGQAFRYSLASEQQRDREVKVLEDDAWLKYGPAIVDKVDVIVRQGLSTAEK